MWYAMSGPVQGDMRQRDSRNGDMRCLGVLHVPKSGGSSLRVALAQMTDCYTGPLYFDHTHFGATAVAEAVPTPNRETIATLSDLAEITKTHRLIIGHYAGSSLLAAGCHSVALQVREPRSRLLSLYRFWQAQSESVRASWGPWGRDVVAKSDLPLKEFLAFRGAWPVLDNAIARQMLGHQKETLRSARAQRRNASHAYSKFRSKLAVVNWSSRSQSFLEQLCQHLGESMVPTLERVNITPVLADEQRVDNQTSRLIERLTRVDRFLIDQLSVDGVLPARSSSDLDAEYEATATRLKFRLG